MPITRVISGGQIGADIAGLRAAEKLGILTGGYAPKGYKTLEGNKPELLGTKFGLVEMKEDGYIYRTEQNVLNSDGTIRFAHNWRSPGERATMRYITKYKKPHFDVSIMIDGETGGAAFFPRPAAAAIWADRQLISTLNVAGNAYKRYESDIEQYMLLMLKIANGSK